MSESDRRGDGIVTIARHDSIREAARKMRTHNVGCLIVKDENGNCIGLITERDIAHYVAGSPQGLDATQVGHIMADHVVSCPPGTPPAEARRLMASHRIRHLPIVEGGIVVGILSARDILSRQLLEDRAAAEEVAMLSKCLKSIDLAEAVETVAAEAPRLFAAHNCVLCLHPDGDRTRDPELINSNRCPCVAGHVRGPEGVEIVSSPEDYYDKGIPAACKGPGGSPPRLVLPLEIIGLPQRGTGQEKRLSGYLCMCGLSPEIVANRELVAYKARLTREIVEAHLTNAIRYEQARLSSLTDALTGVGSRKLLEDRLREECDRAKRYTHPFSIAIMDLDHFKMINDTLGHAAGDEAIRMLAECIKRDKRGPDVLVRYGGDEFVMLLPETAAEEAAVLLERIREQVQRIPLEQNMALSMSCGIAQSNPASDDPAGDVMRRADLALYEAKNSGRNCVKLWDESMDQLLLSSSDLEIDRIKKLQRRLLGLSEKAETLFMESIWSLVQALEAKDAFSGKHSEHVMIYAVAIARTMELGPRYVELVHRAAMIHDIGKIGIPDAVLFKPDHLTPHERRIIEQHPLIAVKILERMSFLEREVAIIRHHHEKWNGSGYPDGLSRTAIPLGARIIAVADTFDALTSHRAYHSSRSVVEALSILTDSAGYDLDPTAVNAMVAWVEEITRRRMAPRERLSVGDLLTAERPQLERVQAVGAEAGVAAHA